MPTIDDTDRHTRLRQALRDIYPDAGGLDEPDLWELAAAVERDRAAYGVRLGLEKALEPEPELDTSRLHDVEQFRLAQVYCVPQTRDDGVAIPQVLLVLEGTPAQLTLTGHRTYVTALTGDTAMGVGKAALEAGKAIKRAEGAMIAELEVDAPASRLVTATPADMARATGAARAAERLATDGAPG